MYVIFLPPGHSLQGKLLKTYFILLEIIFYRGKKRQLLEAPISEKYTLLTIRVWYLDADLLLVHFLSPLRLRCQIHIQIPGWNHRKFLP